MGSGAKCRGPGHNVWVRREILFAPAHKYFSMTEGRTNHVLRNLPVAQDFRRTFLRGTSLSRSARGMLPHIRKTARIVAFACCPSLVLIGVTPAGVKVASHNL